MFVREELILPLKYAEIPLKLLKKRKKIAAVLPVKTEINFSDAPKYTQNFIYDKNGKPSKKPVKKESLIDTYA